MALILCERPVIVLIGAIQIGRPPFPAETVLRIHSLQQWFGLSDPATEEALHRVLFYRENLNVPEFHWRLPWTSMKCASSD